MPSPSAPLGTKGVIGVILVGGEVIKEVYFTPGTGNTMAIEEIDTGDGGTTYVYYVRDKKYGWRTLEEALTP